LRRKRESVLRVKPKERRDREREKLKALPLSTKQQKLWSVHTAHNTQIK